ncbi:MAG: hypothetical protein B6U86_01400 [Candidatus Altiarchaeales archaeon ex4484_43]|nr:MAG: hypothetical protein B6U86_01400 [Candidatus Altiarchaeales archaeon ex4484_43]RLI89231.1 MAG: hypothetical protein DRO62_02055 [Candidatus Altiarchaeales archaeon]
MEILKTLRDVLGIVRDLLIIAVMTLSLLLTWKIYGMVCTFSSAMEKGEFPFGTTVLPFGESYSTISTIPLSIPGNINVTGDSRTDAEIGSLLRDAMTSYLQGDKNGSIDSLNQLEDILRGYGETVLLIKIDKLKGAMEEDNQSDVMKYSQEIASYLGKRS